ncbi:hypothetical protein [Streptomyces sp. NPDC048603]|uniref:hypothetical protein n=1 Tax=Streptomyces sp. NPDC048603 TaxID=3365577 RepID=UPI003720F85A
MSSPDQQHPEQYGHPQQPGHPQHPQQPGHPQHPQQPQEPGHQPPQEQQYPQEQPYPQGQQYPQEQHPLPQDPYATQTWQSQTWDTMYQPALGALPGQGQAPAPEQAQPLAAPDSWFRDEPAGGQPAGQPVGGPVPQPDPWSAQPYRSQAAGPGETPPQQAPQQSVAPESWFRDPAPGDAPAQVPQQSQAPGGDPAAYADPYQGAGTAPAPGQAPYGAPYEDPYAVPGGTQGAAAAETAYLPPYREEQADPAQQSAAPVAPEGWFRDPAPAAQAADPAAAQTAYLPPVQADPAAVPPQAATPAAAETAYLPPYLGAPPGPQGPGGEPQGGPLQETGHTARDAAETAYLPPYPGTGTATGADQGTGAGAAMGAEAAAQTAYLPPYPTYDTPDPVAEPGAAAAAAAASTAGTGTGGIGMAAGAGAAAVAGHAADPVAEPAAAEAYSTPTLAGTTRPTRDPSQARAEGRSPIIDPGPQSALLTAVLGVLLAAAAVIGDLALVVPLVLLQGLTAAGWFRLNGMWPARQGIALAFAGAVAADIAVLAVDGSHGPGAVIGTLGAWVLLTLVLQLRSHADPDERMYGLMASVASAALAIVCAGFLAADSAAVTTGAAAVAVTVFTRALPLPPAPSVGVSLAAAAGAGLAVGGLTSIGAGGALVGLAAGVCALIGLRVAAYDYPSKFVHMTAGVALPLAAAAPAVYLMGRVVN